MSPRDLLLATCVPLTWGLGFTLSKAALAEFPPLFLMSMRFFVAVLLLLWFVPIPRGCLKDLFWIALVGSTIQYGLTFTGLSMIDASLAVIVIHLEVPFGVLLAAIVLREHPGAQRWIGMLVAFVGIGLIAGQPELRGQLFAVLLTASGALTWAIGQIMFKKISGRISGLTAVAWIGVFAAPQMLLGSLFIESDHINAVLHASWIGWGSVLYLGVIMTALGYGIWYSVLARNPVSQVMPVLLLLPIFTIVSAAILLGERPSLTVLSGGVVVLVGVALIIFTRNPAAENRS